MTDYLYRVRIIKFPEGSTEPVSHAGDKEPDHWVPVRGWAPPGWKPEGNYIKLVGTDQFVWPSTRQVYRSRSTAKRRAALLESFGAVVVIERSNKIVWPEYFRDVGMASASTCSQKPAVGKASRGLHELDELSLARLRRRLMAR